METSTIENERRWWRQLLLPLLVTALLIFAFSGTRPLMDTSEARYAEASREMAMEGHWIVPHLSGRPHLTKPPVTYWLVGIAIRTLGQQEWAARLPIGLCALATVLITACLARGMFGPRVGLWAAWMQGLALVPLGAANVITTDTPLATLETGAMWCAWMLLAAPDARRARPWQLGFYAFLGAAFLTKGPAGLVPLAGLLVFCLAARRSVPWRRLWSPWGLALFLLITVPWPVAVLASEPHALQIWRREAVLKVFEEATHDFPRWAYPLLLIFGSFPATVGLGLAVTRWVKERSLHAPLPWLFLGCWLVLSLVVLSIQKTRLPLYILPLFPTISITAAWGAAALSWDSDPRTRRRLAVALAVYCVVFIGGKWYYSATVERRDARRSFKQVAEIIRRAEGAPGTAPTVYTKEGRLGYGLMYYLGSHKLVRTAMKGFDGTVQWPRTFREVLETTPTPGLHEYFLVEHDEKAKAAEELKNFATRVGATSAYSVWKRNQP
jgi:4-amino-4-deoxy-L-arabinose transferase